MTFVPEVIYKFVSHEGFSTLSISLSNVRNESINLNITNDNGKKKRYFFKDKVFNFNL